MDHFGARRSRRLEKAKAFPRKKLYRDAILTSREGPSELLLQFSHAEMQLLLCMMLCSA